MLWIKSFHIISMVAWFAGLFYLPRLFVYHAQTQSSVQSSTFMIMERRLYRYIMWPAGILTISLGILLLQYNWNYYSHAGWLHAKIALVFLLCIFHLFCGSVVKKFAAAQNNFSEIFYRVLNEIPTILLVAIVILVVVKPF
jgi:putative membrane protein